MKTIRKKVAPPTPQNLRCARTTSEYWLGAQAYKTGLRFTDAPFQGDTAVYWWIGYLDARTEKRLGHVFRKYEACH